MSEKAKKSKHRQRWFYALLRQRFSIIFLLVLQIILFLIFLLSSSQSSQYVRISLHVISLIVCIWIISQEEKQAYKVVWVFLILLLPVFGGMFYLLFKNQTSKKRVSKYLQKHQLVSELPCDPEKDKLPLLEISYPNQAPIAKYLQNTAGFPLYTNTNTLFFPLGEFWYEDMINELKSAQKYIFLEYFIIEEGKFWDSVLEILQQKASEGVDVRLIYDDIGCFLTLPKKYRLHLEKMGIKCHVFNKFRPIISGFQNNRDHRKITSIDGKTAYTGGCNMADEYINHKQKHGHWKDCALKLEGEGAWGLTLIFLQMWQACSGQKEDWSEFYPYADSPCDISNSSFVQPYADSPLDRYNVGENVYISIIQNAKKYLYINTPYLIPDETIFSALLLCARSGVDVKIITPAIWDKKFVHVTTRSYYRDLIAAGVEIYEYSEGFNHSKTFLCDDEIATVGTTNLDYRSLYLHFECGVRLVGAESIQSIKQDYISTLKRCKRITEENCRANLPLRIIQSILRIFAPLM